MRGVVSTVVGVIVYLFLGYFVLGGDTGAQMHSVLWATTSGFGAVFGVSFAEAAEGEQPAPSLVTDPGMSKPHEPWPIGVKLLRKDVDQMGGVGGKRIDLFFELMNQADRDVQAFSGTIVVMDPDNGELVSLDLTYDRGLKAGKSTRWRGHVAYDLSNSRHQRLHYVHPLDLTVEFVMKDVTPAAGADEQSTE